jgi:hypothetical protein
MAIAELGTIDLHFSISTYHNTCQVIPEVFEVFLVHNPSHMCFTNNLAIAVV